MTQTSLPWHKVLYSEKFRYRIIFHHPNFKSRGEIFNLNHVISPARLRRLSVYLGYNEHRVLHHSTRYHLPCEKDWPHTLCADSDKIQQLCIFNLLPFSVHGNHCFHMG